VRGCLEQLLGVPYPFRNLQSIEMNDWASGQAPPGVIVITKDALLSQAGVALVDQLERPDAAASSRTANERIAHEVAHDWFPHVAKVDRGEENWLSESVSEYMSTVCLESASADRARGRLIYRRQISRWKDRAGQIHRDAIDQVKTVAIRR
jgi:aminopeptidase N